LEVSRDKAEPAQNYLLYSFIYFYFETYPEKHKISDLFSINFIIKKNSIF